MQVRPLAIDGAWEFTPRTFGDDRGLFLEWFKADVVAEAIGHHLTVAQANQSVSRRGVVRGVHFASVPPGQAKYIYCPRGAALDVIIDIRIGSPSFGRWDAVRLDEVDRRGVYIAEGLGHAFVALEDDTALTYLCSTPYSPGSEFTISPLDPALDLPLPAGIDPVLSPRDAEAPTLAQAQERGLLPEFDKCQAFYESLRIGG